MFIITAGYYKHNKSYWFTRVCHTKVGHKRVFGQYSFQMNYFGNLVEYEYYTIFSTI